MEKCCGTPIDQTRETGVSKDLVEGLTEGNVKFKDMQSHLDYVTGLAVGGMDFTQFSFIAKIMLSQLKFFLCCIF